MQEMRVAIDDTSFPYFFSILFYPAHTLLLCLSFFLYSFLFLSILGSNIAGAIDNFDMVSPYYL